MERVEFSLDGGHTWADAALGEPVGRYAWVRLSYEWNVREPSEYELCARATDSSGQTQPTDNDEAWNQGGYGVQRVAVVVV